MVFDVFRIRLKVDTTLPVFSYFNGFINLLRSNGLFTILHTVVD